MLTTKRCRSWQLVVVCEWFSGGLVVAISGFARGLAVAMSHVVSGVRAARQWRSAVP